MTNFNRKVELYTARMHESRDKMVKDVQFEIERLDGKAKAPEDTLLHIPKAEFQATIGSVTAMMLQISNLLRGLVERGEEDSEE